MNKLKNYVKMFKISLSISFKASPSIMLLRIFTMIIGAFIPLLNSIALKNIIDGLIQADTQGTLDGFILLSVTQLFSAVIGKITAYYTTLHQDRISLIISNDLADSVNKLDISYFDNPELYNEMSNVSSDINTIPSLIWDVLGSIQISIQLFIAFVVVSDFGWWMAPVICITCLPNFIVDKRNSMKFYNWNRDVKNDIRRMNYSYDTLVSKYFSKDIRVKSLSGHLISNYHNMWAVWYKQKKKLLFNQFLGSFFTMFLPHIATLSFLFILIESIFKGQYSVGDFSYYLGNMNQIINCTLSLVAFFSKIIQQRVKIEHYNNFKNWKPLITLNEDGKKVHEFKSIEFIHVSFKYPNTDVFILNDISFKIKKGEKIGLVGKNGSGKSTIIKLLLGLYKPNSGTILLNGENISNYDLKSYRALISEMLQDYVNYSFSLRENIIMSDIEKQATDDEIIRACKMSDSYDFVKTWPNGLDSYLTKSFDIDGVELSGGQWQKLALARFFYKKAALFIMDEPSASLDIESEAVVFDNVLNFLPNSTILLVSHRLSNIKMMDRILVLDAGVITEQGTHNELLQNNKLYSKLYNLQLDKIQ